MVGRLELGVVALEFGVVGRLAGDPERARDPDRRRGNRCGETVRFSDKFALQKQNISKKLSM